MISFVDPLREAAHRPESDRTAQQQQFFTSSGKDSFFSFFFPRQEECWGQWEPHQARFALVFSFFFFPTSGGVLGAGAAPNPICPPFFLFFLHVRKIGTAPAARPGGRSLSRLLVEFVGASHAFCLLFFQALHHLAT